MPRATRASRRIAARVNNELPPPPIEPRAPARAPADTPAVPTLATDPPPVVVHASPSLLPTTRTDVLHPATVTTTPEVMPEPSALDIALSELALARLRESQSQSVISQLLNSTAAPTSTMSPAPSITRQAQVKIVKLPEYDGKRHYDDFRLQASAILTAYDLETAALSLISCLRGDALQVLRTIPDEHRRSHAHIDKALMDAYGGMRSKHQIYVELSACVQTKDESVRSFANRLNTLFREANGDTGAEEQLLARFYVGMQDDSLSRQLRLQRYTTFREAVEWASIVERPEPAKSVPAVAAVVDLCDSEDSALPPTVRGVQPVPAPPTPAV